MLLDVLTRVSADTGLDAVQKRSTLLNILNNAAKIMHKQLETTSIFREVTLAVPIDKVVALPSFVGDLRGTRMHTNELPFDVHSIGSPRYVSNTLGYKYKNWRDLGETPVTYLTETINQLKIISQQTEAEPVTLFISGETPKATRFEEQVVLDAGIKYTTNLFGPTIYSISCPAKRLYDITVKDADDNVLAVLHNDMPKTRYKLIDVSQVFWTIDTSDGDCLVDVMYKLPATTLFRDSDSFYAGDDFDEIWYQMSMHVFYKPIQNRQADASTYFKEAMLLLQAIKDSNESGIVKKVSFGRNKFYNLFKKYRYYPGSVTNVDHNVGS